MSGRDDRIPMKDGDEYDALTAARKWYVFGAGTRRAIKNQYNRRRRRMARAAIKRGGSMQGGTSNRRIYIPCFEVEAVSSSLPGLALKSHWAATDENGVRALIAEHDRFCGVKTEVLSIHPHLARTYVWCADDYTPAISRERYPRESK